MYVNERYDFTPVQECWQCERLLAHETWQDGDNLRTFCSEECLDDFNKIERIDQKDLDMILNEYYNKEIKK